MAKSKYAESITIQVGQQKLVAPLRQFKSGKWGYGFYGKLFTEDGTQIQASLNLVIPHSENA